MYKIFVFLCVLNATGYTEPSKNDMCKALIEVFLPRGLNLASLSVIAGTYRCDGKMQTSNSSHFPQAWATANHQLSPVVFKVQEPLGLVTLSDAV